jgi:glycerol-3-phosphate acyltransferase PlsY
MVIWLILLIVAAYLLGSVPGAYLVARYLRGIDLRRYGTGQIGGGNLWRMTSWRLGIPVGIFDLTKGMAMVWVAQLVGLSIWQQILVGTATMVGHNWSVFLRFSGGRGLATTIGVVLILPLVNSMAPWATVSFFSFLVIGSVLLRSSAFPVLAAAVSLPVTSAFFEPIAVTLGFLFLVLVLVAKRLTASRSLKHASISKWRVLLNRLLFDRDIADRKAWMYRIPAKGSDMEKLKDGID